MGESAGGGSILYQMTAYGASQGPAPFQQAIIQSPAWIQDIGVEQQENTLRQFLQSLNVSTIQEARQLPSNLLIEANSELIGKSPYGTFIIDPVRREPMDSVPIYCFKPFLCNFGRIFARSPIQGRNLPIITP